MARGNFKDNYFNDVKLILSRNDGIKVDDLRWFSVYSRKFEEDFGNIVFPYIVT